MKILDKLFKRKPKTTEKSTDVFVDPNVIDIDRIRNDHGRVIDSNDMNDQIGTIVGFRSPIAPKVHEIMYGAEKFDYSRCGEVVRARSDGRVGVILYKINESGQIVVLHGIQPFIYCTYTEERDIQKLYSFDKHIERR